MNRVFPASPRAFKVMAIANHLGIDTTLRIVDLVKGDQRSPEYALLNPNMRMPTLKDGDYVLWESNAMSYGSRMPSESGLLPADEKARLDVTALAVLGPCALGSRVRSIHFRKRRQIGRAQEWRTRRGSNCQGRGVVSSRGKGA